MKHISAHAPGSCCARGQSQAKAAHQERCWAQQRKESQAQVCLQQVQLVDTELNKRRTAQECSKAHHTCHRGRSRWGFVLGDLCARELKVLR
jgi:hypothetical protein